MTMLLKVIWGVLIWGIVIGMEMQVESVKRIKLQLKHPGEYYTVKVGIGKDKENEGRTFVFEAQVDTTIGWTWVPSVDLNDTFVGNMTNEGERIDKYDRNQSVSNEETNDTVLIVDENGDVSGRIAIDTLSIDNRIITLEKFAFVTVDTFDKFYTDFPNGKLGLGYRNDHANSSFIGMMKDKGIIMEKIFTITENDNDNQAELYIGGIPPKYNDYPYSICSLASTEELDDEYRGGWICELTHIMMGPQDQVLSDSIEVSARVIFDSGYNRISIPSKYLSVFKENFVDKYFNTDECWLKTENLDSFFECDIDDRKLEGLAITFIMEGYGYVIPSHKLFAKNALNKHELLLRFRDENDNIWSFGYPFLSQYAIVYNAEESHVGFYGGEKEDFITDWELWKNHTVSNEKHQRMLLMIVGLTFLGIIFLMVIVFIILKAFMKKRNWENEHSGLMNNEHSHPNA